MELSNENLNDVVPWGEVIPISITFKSDRFNIIKETLSRMGVADTLKKVLHQSCHIVCENNVYSICHYKEITHSDGELNDITVEDILRRNRIIQMLVDYDLIEVLSTDFEQEPSPTSHVRMFILPHKEKFEWILKSSYDFAHRRKV